MSDPKEKNQSDSTKNKEKSHYIGESKKHEENIRKGAEIPPKKPTPPKKESK